MLSAPLGAPLILTLRVQFSAPLSEPLSAPLSTPLNAPFLVLFARAGKRTCDLLVFLLIIYRFTTVLPQSMQP